MDYRQHNKQLKRELKRLKQEIHLLKWEKWEECAKSLYCELHGKEAKF